MKTFKTLIITVALAIGISSCKKDNNTLDTNPAQVDNALHFSFKTTDWEKKVDCSHLDLFGDLKNETTLSVWIPSASTNATFIFNYPSNYSQMILANNLKKYAINDFASYEFIPFTLSLKLPLTNGSTERLISNTGFSDNEYCEITEIKYLKSTDENAQFAVKGKYSLKARVLNNEGATPKIITGTFNWKVNTSKK